MFLRHFSSTDLDFSWFSRKSTVCGLGCGSLPVSQTMELCRFLVFCFVFAFCKFVYIYFHFILKAERARKKQTQAVRSSKCWFTTQMTTKNQDWARSKLKPRPGSRSPPRVAGTQLLEQSPDASQSAHHQEATFGRTAMTQNQALQYGNEASSLWGQM